MQGSRVRVTVARRGRGWGVLRVLPLVPGWDYWAARAWFSSEGWQAWEKWLQEAG